MKIKFAYKIMTAATLLFWLIVFACGFAYFKLAGIKAQVSSLNHATSSQIIGIMDQGIHSLILVQGILIVLAFIGSLGFTIYLIRNVNKPLDNLNSLLKSISTGDLTAKVNSVDVVKTKDELEELGYSCKEMYQNLRKILLNIFIATDKILETSTELSKNAEDNLIAIEQVTTAIGQISAGTMEQANDLQLTSKLINKLNGVTDSIKNSSKKLNENVELTVETIRRMSTAIETVMKNNQLIAQDTQGTYQAANEGKDLVDETIADMQNIKNVVLDLGEKITTLGSRSQQIGEIVGVIEDIAQQTNLLALNAAIEAARAGEHGKGFAIVADEVRKLAENSQKSTEEIANLITDIRSDIEIVTEGMTRSTADVEKGAQVAYKAGTALRNIITAITKVVGEVEEINAAMGTMNNQNKEMVDSINVIAEVMEENNRITEELAQESKSAMDSIMNISSISEENAASTEEVNSSTEMISHATNEIKSGLVQLNELIADVQKTSRFFRLK